MNKKAIAVVSICAAAAIAGVCTALVARRNKHREEKEYTETETTIPVDSPDIFPEDRFRIVEDRNQTKKEISEKETNVEIVVPDVNGGKKLEDLVARYSGDGNSVKVIGEDEYKASDYNNRYELQYFVLDDILAWATTMEQVEPDDDIFIVGVNALMNTDKESIFLAGSDGSFYEIVSSDENYLDVYKEVADISPDPDDIHFMGKDNEEDDED